MCSKENPLQLSPCGIKQIMCFQNTRWDRNGTFSNQKGEIGKRKGVRIQKSLKPTETNFEILRLRIILFGSCSAFLSNQGRGPALKTLLGRGGSASLPLPTGTLVGQKFYPQGLYLVGVLASSKGLAGRN